MEVWCRRRPLQQDAARDIPVDSNELIALCAPRLIFISHGIPEKGDAYWLDHEGASWPRSMRAGSSLF